MSERILLEYQKTIPKSLRIITNISHTGFFKELEELSDDKIANFFNENLFITGGKFLVLKGFENFPKKFFET